MIRHALSTGVRSFSPIIFRNCRTLRRFSLRSFDDFNQPRCLVSGAKKRFSSLTNEWSDEQFQSVVNGNKLVVFMKGTPEGPQCGFSKYVIQILHMHGCTDFMTLNVLEDEILRSRVKEFSNWPTIPQVYMAGEFVGGFDILLQLHQSGELIEEFEKIGHRSALLDVDKKEE